MSTYVYAIAFLSRDEKNYSLTNTFSCFYFFVKQTSFVVMKEESTTLLNLSGLHSPSPVADARAGSDSPEINALASERTCRSWESTARERK